MVYVGGSTPDLSNARIKIVTLIRRDNPKHMYYGTSWRIQFASGPEKDQVSNSPLEICLSNDLFTIVQEELIWQYI